MARWKRVYIFAVLGAFGGLLGAALHQWLLLDILARPIAPAQRSFYNALLGLLVGASIGFFPRFAEGIGHYSFVRGARDGIIGACLGGLGGALAVSGGEMLHKYLGGHVFGRSAAFGLLGLTIGLAEGIAGGAKPWRGIVGGFAGGVVAGGILEFLLAWKATYSDSAILALILLGLSISVFVSLFVTVLSEAWLEGLPGSKVAGQVYQLSKFHEPNRAILGSGKDGGVFIWIPAAEQSHASITITEDGALLHNLAKNGETQVNGTAVREHLLKDGQVIGIGSARLMYHELRRKAAEAKSASIGPPRRIKILSQPTGS